MPGGIYHAEQKNLRHPKARIRIRPCRNCRVLDRASAVFSSDTETEMWLCSTSVVSSAVLTLALQQRSSGRCAVFTSFSAAWLYLSPVDCQHSAKVDSFESTQLWRPTSRAFQTACQSCQEIEPFELIVEGNSQKISNNPFEYCGRLVM